MTTNAECTAAAAVLNAYAPTAALAGLGGGGTTGTNPFEQVTDGNLNYQLGAGLTAAAAALTAIGQGGSHAANTSAQYIAWAADVQIAVAMARGAGNAPTAESLATAMEVLNNLSLGL